MNFNSLIKKLMAIVRGIKVTPVPPKPPIEVLPQPLFGTITKTETSISVPITNVPSGASVAWVFNGVLDGYTGSTLSKSGLTANTSYSISAKFTKSGIADSQSRSTTITTNQATPEVLPAPTFGTVTKTTNSFSIPVTNLPSGASVIWTVNSIVESGQTGSTLSKSGLSASTAYSVTAKYTKSGVSDSSVTSTSITTNANSGVTKADLNAYNTNAFYADVANVVGGGPLVNGAIISGFPDALTDKVIPYAGATSPSRGRPHYFDGAVTFYNESNAYFYGYDSGQGWPTYTNPQEMTFVFRDLPGQDFEAYSIDNYIGKGGGQLRVAGQFGWLSGATAPTPLQINVIHIAITQSGSNRTWRVWKNGTEIGTYTGTDPSRGSYAVNVHTNASDHDFMAKFYKQGAMSDSDRAEYLSKVNTYFGAGSYPNRPYASNVTCNKSGNSYTANYVYNGLNPENVAAVEYEWYELENNGAFTQHKLPGTTKTITYSGTRDIRPSVKVTDNQGNTWKFVNYPGWIPR